MRYWEEWSVSYSLQRTECSPPNAGIDRSNIGQGKAVLYPRNPLESASTMVEAMEFRHGVRIGMVVSATAG